MMPMNESNKKFADNLCKYFYGGRDEEDKAAALIVKHLCRYENTIQDAACVLASGDASGCGILCGADIILRGKAMPNFHSVLTDKLHYAAEKMRTHDYILDSLVFTYTGDTGMVRVKYYLSIRAHIVHVDIEVFDLVWDCGVVSLEGECTAEIAASLI